MTKEQMRFMRIEIGALQREIANDIHCTQGLISMFEIGLVSTDSKKAKEYEEWLMNHFPYCPNIDA